jgi:hypothetical protein
VSIVCLVLFSFGFFIFFLRNKHFVSLFLPLIRMCVCVCLCVMCVSAYRWAVLRTSSSPVICGVARRSPVCRSRSRNLSEPMVCCVSLHRGVRLLLFRLCFFCFFVPPLVLASRFSLSVCITSLSLSLSLSLSHPVLDRSWWLL